MTEEMDAPEAAQYLKIPRRTVQRLATLGEIPGRQDGTLWRFAKIALDEWAAAQERTMSRTALVVDDEETLHAFISEVLEDEGFQVRTALHGREALEVLRATPVDIAFLDLMMPHMGGVELLRTIRAEFGSMPVVIVTGYPTSHLVSEILPFSPITLLEKPCTSRQILDCLSMVREEQN